MKTRLLIVIACLLSACSYTPEGITPVRGFEADKYLGTWYEIARLDHSFERGLERVTATYSKREDGGIKVINRGFDTEKQEWKEAEGKAYFIEGPDVGKLKVSFFGPFYGGYHVAALDPDYRWALVLGPDTSYCWILARDKQLDAAQRDAIVARAQALGVDTHALIWVTHKRQDPAHPPH